MNRWEYLRLTLSESMPAQVWTVEPPLPFPSSLAEDLVDALNQLGDEGWELIGLADWPGRRKVGRELLLKRCIPPR